MHIRDILARLPPRHAAALQWFADNAGTKQTWPRPLVSTDGETLLASKAKGIYKPVWSQYALSVRQSLAGPYPDRDPVLRPDNTWLYSYFQENDDPAARDGEYTNLGLLECWRDGVPVGVMRQISAKPNSRYLILGIAIVSGWDGGYFFLEGFAPDGHGRSRGSAGEMELLSRQQEQLSQDSGSFDPNGVIDARERVVAQIVRRRGQPEFRRQVLMAYDYRCAISECDAIDALEAAHIMPYRGPATNRIDNGVLLRADLHTLFDLGLLAINPETMTVLISPKCLNTSYAGLMGKPLRLPADTNFHPSVEALAKHRRWAGF